ncbi:MAG: ROK family protein, partial [Bacteroidales bacterium]|nr:ROK family protein [Bacteroidales bacterium]
MEEVAIGIDIGGTNTVLGLIDRNGKNLGEGSVSTGSYSDIEMFVLALYEQINVLISNAEEEMQIKGIGIVAPMG